MRHLFSINALSLIFSVTRAVTLVQPRIERLRNLKIFGRPNEMMHGTAHNAIAVADRAPGTTTPGQSRSEKIGATGTHLCPGCAHGRRCWKVSVKTPHAYTGGLPELAENLAAASKPSAAFIASTKSLQYRSIAILE